MGERIQGDGWSSPRTAELAGSIRADATLHAEVLERINGNVAADSFDEAVTQAGAEIAAAWGGQFEVASNLGDIDWHQLGESFLLEVITGGPRAGP